MPRSLFLLLLVLSALAPRAVQAGSVSAGSIWNQANAAMRARSQVPKGAHVTDTRCVTVQVRNDNHYRCTVTYSRKPETPDR